VEIIPASTDHIPAIVDLWQEFMDYHRDMDSRFPMRSDAPARQETHLRDSLLSDDSLLLTAISDGQVVGYSLAEIQKYPPLFTRERCGYISDMFVRPDFRRKGTGESMLEKMYSWFDRQNLDRIELSVAVQNTIGYSFWKKHGFTDYIHRLYLDRNNREK